MSNNIEQELKIIRSDINDLKAEISSLNKNFSAIEELLRLLVANQMLNNLEIKKPPKPKKTKPKITVTDTPSKKSIEENSITFNFGKIFSTIQPSPPKEIVTGHAEIYAISKLWTAAQIIDGVINESSKIRILRGKKKLFTTSINKMQQISFDCFKFQFVGVDVFNELEKGDIIEAYKLR